MTKLWIPLVAFVVLCLWVLAIADSLRKERAYAWTALLVFLPPLGMPLYALNFAILGDEKLGMGAVLRRISRRQRIDGLKQRIASHPIRGEVEELARLLLEEGRPEDALTVLRPMLDADPDDLPGQLIAAKSLMALRRVDKAIPILEYITGEDWGYDSYRAAGALALAYQHVGRKEEALAILERTIRLSRRPEHVFVRALLLLELGKRDIALEELTAYLDHVAPGDVPANERVWLKRMKSAVERLKKGN